METVCAVCGRSVWALLNKSKGQTHVFKVKCFLFSSKSLANWSTGLSRNPSIPNSAWINNTIYYFRMAQESTWQRRANNLFHHSRGGSFSLCNCTLVCSNTNTTNKLINNPLHLTGLFRLKSPRMNQAPFGATARGSTNKQPSQMFTFQNTELLISRDCDVTVQK